MNNKLKRMSKNGSDDFQTPPEALKPLIPFLKKEWLIWECAEGQGYIKKELKNNGFKVIGSDKEFDFIKNTIDEFDCIVTNPPYSLKNEFIEKCYVLNKTFALLLPLTALESNKRQEYWKKGLQLILLNKRINFIFGDNSKKSNWFATAWFTYGLNLPSDIYFGEI